MASLPSCYRQDQWGVKNESNWLANLWVSLIATDIQLLWAVVMRRSWGGRKFLEPTRSGTVVHGSRYRTTANEDGNWLRISSASNKRNKSDYHSRPRLESLRNRDIIPTQIFLALLLPLSETSPTPHFSNTRLILPIQFPSLPPSSVPALPNGFISFLPTIFTNRHLSARLYYVHNIFSGFVGI
jgi:hypothetical protein